MWRTDQARSHEVVAIWCGYRPFAGGVGWADFGILPYPKLILGSYCPDPCGLAGLRPRSSRGIVYLTSTSRSNLGPLLRLIASTAKETDRIRNDAADSVVILGLPFQTPSSSGSGRRMRS